MTEIEKKALALVNEVLNEHESDLLYAAISRAGNATTEALCRAIEQHEAFKQEVSDAVELNWRGRLQFAPPSLSRFILPNTVDPLVDVLADCDWLNSPTLAADIREALAKRGLKIVETGQ